MLTYEEPEHIRELEEESRAYAYDRYPWQVVVASESYKSGYKVATRRVYAELARVEKQIQSLIKQLALLDRDLSCITGEQTRRSNSIKEADRRLKG